jgi:hypothetical protein
MKTKKPEDEAKDVVVVASSVPAPSVNYALLEEDGNTNSFNQEDMTIPFLKILQGLSPEISTRKAEYIQGAEAGMFCNSVTKTLYSGETGIVVIPVVFTREHIEWKANRGGFVKTHGPSGSILANTTKNDKNQDVLPGGNTIETAGMYYVFIVDETTGSYEPAVIKMSATQLKKAKQWNTLIATIREPKADGSGFFNPASFAVSYRLRTGMESNDQGEWFGFSITTDGRTLSLPFGESIYLEARAFKKMITDGKVKTDSHDNAGAAAKPDFVPPIDDDIAF